MNTRTWIVTGSLATVVATGGIAAAMADSNDDRDLDAVTVNGPQVSAPSPAGAAQTRGGGRCGGPRPQRTPVYRH